MLCGWVRCSKGYWVFGVIGSLELIGGEVFGFEFMFFVYIVYVFNYFVF